MEEKDFVSLGVGDIVQNRSGNSYVIIEKFPCLIAMRTIRVSNISEWVLVGKNNLNPDKLTFPLEATKI